MTEDRRGMVLGLPDTSPAPEKGLRGGGSAILLIVTVGEEDILKGVPLLNCHSGWGGGSNLTAGICFQDNYTVIKKKSRGHISNLSASRLRSPSRDATTVKPEPRRAYQPREPIVVSVIASSRFRMVARKVGREGRKEGRSALLGRRALSPAAPEGRDSCQAAGRKGTTVCDEARVHGPMLS
jgi:hypothetical protein